MPKRSRKQADVNELTHAMAETERSLVSNCNCEEELADVKEACRRLADQDDKVISFDDLRRELEL